MSTSRKTVRATGTSPRLIILTVGAAVMVLPFAYMVSTVFKPQAYVLETPLKLIPDPSTVDSFVQTWMTQDFSRYALSSAFVPITSTALAVWLPSMMVYTFARSDFSYREWPSWALLLSLMIPSMMLIIPQLVLTRQLHFTDSLQVLVLFYMSEDLALNTFLLRSSSEGIPRELDEAIEVDGANVWTRCWHLAMLLTRPTLVTTVTFTFLATWDEFAWALTIVSTETEHTLPIVIQLSHEQNSTQWGLVFAASLTAILPVIVVYLIFQRHFIAGLTAGVVKR